MVRGFGFFPAFRRTYLINEEDGINEESGVQFFVYYMKKLEEGGHYFCLLRVKVRWVGAKHRRTISEDPCLLDSQEFYR